MKKVELTRLEIVRDLFPAMQQLGNLQINDVSTMIAVAKSIRS